MEFLQLPESENFRNVGADENNDEEQLSTPTQESSEEQVRFIV